LGVGRVTETIAVWVSCGLASAVAAKLTFERYGSHDIRLVNNPVIEEGEDNRRFLAEVAVWVGLPIESVTHPNYPACAEEVWDRRGAMVFPHGAPCTVHLKKEARQIWERNNPVDWHVLGFTSEEQQRHDRFVLTERSNVIPVLIDAAITKQDCMDIVVGAGIKPPAAYALGYPNANCRGCVKMTSPTGWNLVRRVDPGVFASRAKQSRRLGTKLVRYRGQRIFLDELPADAIGRPLKKLVMPDCSSFCEEPPITVREPIRSPVFTDLRCFLLD
jgi:hypothetical protein